ncbi:MAG: hypothetical protein CMP10_19820 [Zetaproteobacteria bacterium]|nr:hypothetical protein [Pseudobdellovibrionaceae bacterium]
MLKMYRIQGSSLSPDVAEGSYVLTISWSLPLFFRRFLTIKIGDLVVFRKEGYPLMVKRVKKKSDQGLEVAGTHPHSVDSNQYGTVKDSEILSKVFWIIR